jgi:serine-type D-Ala-D-Ala carboxypeptidase/endopeptidase (penicillin-binding protein 4)
LLEFVSGGVISLWLKMAGYSPQVDWRQFVPSADVPWQVAENGRDPQTEQVLKRYLKILADQGLEEKAQGLWLQTGSQLLAMNQGTQRLPAASLTKVATSWAALQTWGVDHSFETVILTTGPIQNGVLSGDLVILGGGDPVLVAEAAIALGNTLNQLGIRKVTGGLAIAGNFWVDFQADVEKSGETFKRLINAKSWSGDDLYIFQKLPAGTPRPQVAIAGGIAVLPKRAMPPELPVVWRHHSPPLLHLLKWMNTHSNNFLAQSLALNLGGPQKVVASATEDAGVPATEIQLQNGSGLGPENQLSARAVCALFAAIQRYLQPRNLSLADVFPVMGQDLGTLEGRTMPPKAVVKTGTLRDVSALAGVVPTRDRGLVWFTILNRGDNITGLRQQQDRLLQSLIQQWGQAPAASIVTTGHRTSIRVSPQEAIVEAAVEFNSQQQ